MSALPLSEDPFGLAKYSEDQPRDTFGRFTAGASDLSSGSPIRRWSDARARIKERQPAGPDALVKAGLTKAQAAVVEAAARAYSDGKYDKINRDVRNGNKHATGALPQRLATYCAAIRPNTDKPLYRGTAMPRSVLEAAQPGTEFVAPSFWSSSASEGVAHGFAYDSSKAKSGEKRERVVFYIDKSHTAVPMAHLGLGGEKEHLFMPGARFKVTQNSPASGTHTKRMIRMYEVTK